MSRPRRHIRFSGRSIHQLASPRPRKLHNRQKRQAKSRRKTPPGYSFRWLLPLGLLKRACVNRIETYLIYKNHHCFFSFLIVTRYRRCQTT